MASEFRYAHLDSDEARLPEGMQRVGYDADTQTYTFRDSDGSHWESEEGNRYGTLHRAGEQPLLSHDPETVSKRARSSDIRYLAPFIVIVCVVLLLLFRFVDSPGRNVTVQCGEGLEVYQIAKGDTCWDIAKGRGMEVEELREVNHLMLDCEKLNVGSQICVKEVI